MEKNVHSVLYILKPSQTIVCMKSVQAFNKETWIYYK